MIAEQASAPSQEELQYFAARDLLFYVKLCDQRYTVSRFHRFLADRLEDVASGKVRRLIVNCPPQHGKSRLCAIEFPTYLLGKNPRLKVVVASYSQALSVKASRAARKRVTSPQYRYLFPATVLDSKNASVDDWATTEEGGFRAVGVGGSLTGHPADVLIIDDPFKDYEEAHSPGQREKVWEWFLSVAMTRLSPAGVVIVIMTRWHVDDMAGRLLDPDRMAELEALGATDEKYELVKLPAIAQEGDPMGRRPGDALFPERYSAERIRSITALLGSYLTAALYEADPVRKGGNYIDCSKFQIIEPSQVPAGLRDMRYWDLAASEQQKADDTAGAKGAMNKAGDFYIKDMVFGRWEWPKSRTKIKAIAEDERILVGVEAVSGFKTAFANLREVVDNRIVLREYSVDSDKLTRALPWIAAVERGKVFLVKGPWLTAFLRQAEAFPSAAHDDMIDAVSGVYTMLTRSFKPVLV